MINNNEIIDAYNFRHACKIFDKDKKISEENFSTILQTARLSPSSFGFEPWKFLVVQDMDMRKKLLPITWGAQGTLPTASHYVLILARKQNSMRFDSDYILHMMKDIHKLDEPVINQRKAMYENFQKNDFNLLENERNTFDWASKQTFIALGNMMSSAAMLGIDSCPIEGFKAQEMQTILCEEFGVDTKEFGLSAMVAFGYRVNTPNDKTRQDIDDIVKWY